MKVFRIIVIVLVAALVIAQFIPNKLPETSAPNDSDLMAKVTVPPEVSKILKASCYDCHSNETHYPWYSYVAPVSWLIAQDVHDGRDELNFSEWGSYPKRRMVKKLDKIKEEVTEGDMPLPIYTIIHTKTSLNDQQKELIKKWTEDVTNGLMGE